LRRHPALCRDAALRRRRALARSVAQLCDLAADYRDVPMTNSAPITPAAAADGAGPAPAGHAPAAASGFEFLLALLSMTGAAGPPGPRAAGARTALAEGAKEGAELPADGHAPGGRHAGSRTSALGQALAENVALARIPSSSPLGADAQGADGIAA